MLKQVLFQIHWALGITAGLVLAVVGVTGAMMSFEGEIMTALSPDSVIVQREGTRRSPAELAASLNYARPQDRFSSLTIEGNPRRAPQAAFEVANGKRTGAKRETEEFYVDPFTGKLLGAVVGPKFFAGVRELHRWLLLPGSPYVSPQSPWGWGRRITRITTLALIFFTLSGLYMRWPRRPLDWRSWLKLDLRMTGRNFYRSLHAVVGGWVLLAYLLSALTGLWWSFGEDRSTWYRAAVTKMLTGHGIPPEPPHTEGGGGMGMGPPDLANAWAGLRAADHGAFERVIINIPRGNEPVRFQFLRKNAGNSRAFDEVNVDTATGAVISQSMYGGPLGERLVRDIQSVHTGAFFGMPGRVLMMATSMTMPLFTVTGYLLYIGRRKRKRALLELETGESAVHGYGSLLVIYASQTDTAERLARQTAMAFWSAGQPADIVAIDALSSAALEGAQRALFIVSTYGEGEPPDSARGFARRHMIAPAELGTLGYAVLALGDREYPNFCGFGQRVDGWLESSGAHRLFDTIEIDAESQAPLEFWRRGIATLGAASEAFNEESAVYGRWRLVERRPLNPGSLGLPAYHVALEPVTDRTLWEAGDIAEILAGEAPEGMAAVVTSGWPPSRDYSIASIPGKGRVELIVRQVRKEDGQYGVGSGWLTHHARVGEEICLRLRPNPAFRATDDARPVILIGNGTGLAGLLAHIRQRANRKTAPMWLLFGERSRAHDRFHAEELDAYVRAGTLARIDYAFSRDQEGSHYVQDLVAEQGEEIRRWVDGGAAIYVCGSLKGMAPVVDRFLRNSVGEERMNELTDAGLYRRDIY